MAVIAMSPHERRHAISARVTLAILSTAVVICWRHSAAALGTAESTAAETGPGVIDQRDRPADDQPASLSSLCTKPCKCSKDPPRCKTAKTIKDGCDCCHICPRQQGDLCDFRDKCDEDRGLYCDPILDDGHRGVCRARMAKACDVDGQTYHDGKEFKIGCGLLCTCQNGQYACASLCPQEERPPSRAHCRDAQLVRIEGQCCREWVCPHSHSLAQPEDDSNNIVVGAPVTVHSERCVKENTGWSACSASCGMGVSVRLTNDNNECKSKQEHRLCLIRPCNHNDTKSPAATTAGQECRSTWREPKRTKLTNGECVSVDAYRLKYCTTCKRNRCCGPKRTKTIKDVEFQCSVGERLRKENLMWIQSCECKASKTCSYAAVNDRP